ncbi:class I SAM-dependent methyltransferase [Trichlorobacter ammonificans]|uniref:Methyltransferase type 11 domain-containing protein n=1 Tax=Trichlorobacter ammonificans TaxID=2916410 RepID=A0ABN8HBC6_9BACT|nr:class I SAM-dependent methyltransferase [Trichlorobacter ammonificans]CAH2029936.1 protein of unknown function [Trichlorobacter ammonificans]
MNNTKHIQACCDVLAELLAERTKFSPQSLEYLKHDKIISAYFACIRAHLEYDIRPYYASQRIRDFLNATYQDNPFVPKHLDGIDLAVHKLPASTPKNDCLLTQIRNSDIPIAVDVFRPRLAAYRQFLADNVQFYAERFGANALHGAGYFFQKTLEHFITSYLIGLNHAKVILDIGAAGHTYAKIIKNNYPEAVVIAQDLCFPAAAKELGANVFQLGGSAAALPLDDSTVDFVTFHCSVEHFEGSADLECLREVERILKPGGKAVIIPLHHNSRYSIVINPISGPFADDAFMQKVLLQEVVENNACCHYSTAYISRFVRQYSAGMLFERLLSKLALSAKIYAIEIDHEFEEEEILSHEYLNGLYSKYIPHHQRFFLELSKQ